MGKVFFMIIRVLPTFENPDRNRLVGALAHIWVCEDSCEKATNIAMDYIKQFHWEFQSWEQDAIETTLEQLPQTPESTERYLTALRYGVSAYFVGYEKIVGEKNKIN